MNFLRKSRGSSADSDVVSTPQAPKFKGVPLPHVEDLPPQAPTWPGQRERHLSSTASSSSPVQWKGSEAARGNASRNPSVPTCTVTPSHFPILVAPTPRRTTRTLLDQDWSTSHTPEPDHDDRHLRERPRTISSQIPSSMPSSRHLSRPVDSPV